MTTRIPFVDVPRDLMTAMMQVEHYVNACGLNPRLLELLRLRTSQINGCAYCIDMHYKEALAAGEAPLRLYSLSVWRDTDFYDAQEQAALAWCEAITLIHDNSLIDNLFAALQRHFNDIEIARLTLAIAQINSWTRLAKSFGFPAGRYQVGGH